MVQQFDSWRPGRFHEDGNIAPFCINSLDKFTANYLSTGEPSTFAADVTYSEGRNGALRKDRIEVNHPLRIEGDRIYLIGHGFAPTVTVLLPDGEKVTSTMAFIPDDPTTFFSEGAFKFQAPPTKSGRPTEDIGLSGFFAPTPALSAAGVYTSVAPQAKDPVLGFQFDAEAENIGLLLAAHAAVALSGSRKVANLCISVQGRDLIGLAKGILMERHKINAARAFDLLLLSSQNTNTKLRDVAEQLTATGEIPTPATTTPQPVTRRMD